MAFERPTLAELVTRVQADFVSRLDLTGAILRKSSLYVLARVLAGAAHMLHGHLDFLGRQLFPDLSEGEYLERQAAVFGITKTAADYASAVIILHGTDTTLVPAGTVFTRSDGAEYVSEADATIGTLTAWTSTTGYGVGEVIRNAGKIYVCVTAGTSAGSGGPTGTDPAADIVDGTCEWRYVATGTAATIADVTATEAGADGTLVAGDVLNFESPVAGADSTVYVSESVEDGVDEETTEALRTRFLEFMSEPSHGGTNADYIGWAKLVGGVTRVWVEPEGLGPGTVVVRFVRDLDASIIPDAGEVAAVQAILDEYAPAHAAPTAVAPTALARAFTIAVVPDTAAVKAAVEAELTDLLEREGEPGGTILLSAIRTAIGNAEGVTDYTMTVPAADVTHTANQIPTMGTVTWV